MKILKSKTLYFSSIPVILVSMFIYLAMQFDLKTYPSSTFRSVLEITYFITSSLLFIIAIIGLQQLSIARNSAKMNAKREAYKLAAEQCSYYLEVIVSKVRSH
ncbi:hypothetical protein [Paenibacillus sp. FSL P2-0173]|uniref:hypothetical protein n=1 Tax=Paenibacillus sp. FSL P2-0173 TaxID=2921627 RepID=UPI0030FA4639